MPCCIAASMMQQVSELWAACAGTYTQPENQHRWSTSQLGFTPGQRRRMCITATHSRLVTNGTAVSESSFVAWAHYILIVVISSRAQAGFHSRSCWPPSIIMAFTPVRRCAVAASKRSTRCNRDATLWGEQTKRFMCAPVFTHDVSNQSDPLGQYNAFMEDSVGGSARAPSFPCL